MEFVILGLLALRAQTIYEINKALKKSISLFYSASFGSLNTALKRMLAKGLVTCENCIENGRNKKVYRLTPAGEITFQEWLGSDVPQERVKDPALTRVFFLGLLPAAQRMQVLETHLAHLHEALNTLDDLQNTVDQTPIRADFKDAAAYQKLTLQYGRDYYAFSIAWYEKLISELKNQ